MSKINITSGKILKDNTIIEVEYTKARDDAKPAEGGETYKDPPKQSLIDAFAALDVHAALLTEQIPAAKDIDKLKPEAYEDFHCSSFSISETSKKGEGVVITAQKKLSNEKVFGFNTPLTYFNDTSETAYKHGSKLWQAIETVKEELVKYINGDHAPDNQGKIEFPETKEAVPA